MRKLRLKKMSNSTTKYLMGPFDQSLVQIQLDKNEKCIQQLGKNNFGRVAELLKQIKTDCDMISSYNKEKYVIKALSLNTEAYFHQKQNQYESAFKCLEEAEQLQKEQGVGPIDMARTKLNKSVILSHLGRHEEAIKLGRQALELLKKKKEWESFELHKNQYKLYQIMTISFYNIASQLSHMRDIDEAAKVYKEGYYLAQRTLGPTHKLTLLLKTIIKNRAAECSKSKEKSEIQQLGSGRQDQKGLKSILLASTDKQRQLKRIYASKRKTFSINRDKTNKKEREYYLRSLEKIKDMYSRRNREQRREKMYTSNYGEHRKKQFQSNRIITADVAIKRRYESGQPHKIKDILLNGKPINKGKLYSSDRSYTEAAVQHPKAKQKLTVSSTLQPLAPLLPPVIVQQPSKSQNQKVVTTVAEKMEEKRKQSQCQLI